MSNQRNNAPNNKSVDSSTGDENKKAGRHAAALNHHVEAIANEYKSANSEQSKHNGKTLRVNWLAFGVAAFYSLLTVGILGVNVYQLKMLNEGAGDTKRSVEASERSANAATKQAEIAADTEKRQLRAYVGVLPGSITDFGDKQKQTLHMKRQNFGLTPAYNLTWTKLGVFIINKGDLIQTPDVKKKNVDRLQTLFPSASIELNVIGIFYSEEAVNELKKNENKSLVYIGSINYTDAFGVDRFTNYCFMFSFRDGAVMDANYCIGSNDSD